MKSKTPMALRVNRRISHIPSCSPALTPRSSPYKNVFTRLAHKAAKQSNPVVIVAQQRFAHYDTILSRPKPSHLRLASKMPVHVYGYLLGIGENAAGRQIEISEDRLRRLLRAMLRDVEVDEAWYRANKPDVDEAIANGDLMSARDHYITSGYFEDRLPRFIPVDEDWYLEQYPDVAAAVRIGVFTSAQEHFVNAGFREGRLPYPGWSPPGNAVSDPA
jgi:hypothetical protein